jgi:hypothetical protein
MAESTCGGEKSEYSVEDILKYLCGNGDVEYYALLIRRNGEQEIYVSFGGRLRSRCFTGNS